MVMRTPSPASRESWSVSSNGLTYTFHLRDAAFSDGSPVTAQDVKFTLDRFANPKINANYSFLGSSIASTQESTHVPSSCTSST